MLITSIDELKKYIAIDENSNWATFSRFVDQAEQLFMVDLLGQAFYDEFLALYTNSVSNAPVALGADNLKLLPYIQKPLAFYTQLLAIPHISVSFGDMGIRQTRSEDSDAAPRWKEEKLQMNALKNGDIHADKLLEFLELNASVSKYNTWFASTANTKNSGFIIYSTAIASEYIDINNSRRVFMKLRNKIREIETRMVPKLISQDQYDEIVVQLKTGSLTSNNNALLSKIEPIICKRALYMQLPFMKVQINENGIFVYSGTDDLFKPGQLASDSDIKIMRCQLMDEKEFGYLADEMELKNFILDNIDTYPLIKASGVYTSRPDPGPTITYPNRNNNKHFVG
jgi:hypothetical protein